MLTQEAVRELNIEKQGGIKLIYIDPPFDVGADFSLGKYERQHYIGVNPNLREAEQQKQLEEKKYATITFSWPTRPRVRASSNR